MAKLENIAVLRNSEVVSGVSAYNVSVHKWGDLFVRDGGMVFSTGIDEDGAVTISSGGYVENVTVSSGGSMIVSSGGKATVVRVLSGGLLTVEEGGSVGVAALDGEAVVSSGGSVTALTVRRGGYAIISGTVMDLEVRHDGTVEMNGGSASVVRTSGTVYGGFARGLEKVIVGSDGYFDAEYVNGDIIEVRKGGFAETHAFARYHVCSGGKLLTNHLFKDKVVCEEGGEVSYYYSDDE